VFPELNITDADLASPENPPIPWTYKMDWTTRQFVTGPDGRLLKTETYQEYLEEIAKKILNTKRFAYEIYTDKMGVDFQNDVGKMRALISLPVIKTQAEEALEAHSEVDRAEVLDIRFEDDSIRFSLQIEGVRGTLKTEVSAWRRL